MDFTYTAKDSTGTTRQGMITADNEPQARQRLRSQGLFPLSVGSSKSQASAPANRSHAWRRRKVSKTQLLMVTSQLAIMTRSGIDLADAIKNTAAQCSNPAVKDVMSAVYDDVTAGSSVSQALSKHEHEFGTAYVASIAAGEASGQVTEVLSRLASLLRNELRLRSSLRGILAYPVVLVIVASLVISAMVLFVLPQFANVFADLGAPAPPLTRLLLDSAQFIREHLLYLGIALGGLLVAAAWALRTETASEARDWIVLHGMLLKGASRALLTGRAFRLLGTMLESGIPLLDAIRLVRRSVSNRLFRGLFENIEADGVRGDGLSGALSRATFMPEGVAQMVATAEVAGQLDVVIESVGEFYEDDGERRVRQLVKLLEPAIIVVMGIIVATVVLAVMLPLLDVSTMSA
jgi:type II secretory pathway component PulF